MIDLGIRTLFAPDDDTAGEFLLWLGQARKSIHMAVYGFHMPKLVGLLVEKHRTGVEVRLVLDHTQACGRAEKPEIEALLAAGVDVVIGTSCRHGHIMHNKFTVVDGMDVEDGSWNYSLDACLENNVQNYVRSADRAAVFLAKWRQMRDWIVANEPEYQVPIREP